MHKVSIKGIVNLAVLIKIEAVSIIGTIITIEETSTVEGIPMIEGIPMSEGTSITETITTIKTGTATTKTQTSHFQTTTRTGIKTTTDNPTITSITKIVEKTAKREASEAILTAKTTIEGRIETTMVGMNLRKDNFQKEISIRY